MKCVIPAAGLGTRFLPVTKAQPKEMLPVVDKPAIQYVVEEAAASNINDILIITGRGKGAIENHFDHAFELEHKLKESNKAAMLDELDALITKTRFFYVRQKEPNGLGDAILHASHHVGNEDFAVLLGDDIVVTDTPATQQMMDVYDKYGGPVIGLEILPVEQLQRYGVIAGKMLEDGVYKVVDIVEKPAPGDEPSDLAVVGRYILPPEIFQLIREVKPGVNNEIQLTDALKVLCRKRDVYAVVIRGKRYDIGSKVGWLKANIEIAQTRPELKDKINEYLCELQ